MTEGRPSEWPALLDIAIQIIRHAEAQIGFAPSWRFGGGTALMLQIDHRESHDINLFLHDCRRPRRAYDAANRLINAERQATANHLVTLVDQLMLKSDDAGGRT